jgi:hypothetical protein
MTYKTTIFAAAFAVAALQFGGTAANASPMAGFAKSVTVDGAEVQQIHWRSYRHCHWRYGRRYCHGGYRPGVRLYYGPSYHRNHRYHRYHRHHRRHH